MSSTNTSPAITKRAAHRSVAFLMNCSHTEDISYIGHHRVDTRQHLTLMDTISRRIEEHSTARGPAPIRRGPLRQSSRAQNGQSIVPPDPIAETLWLAAWDDQRRKRQKSIVSEPPSFWKRIFKSSSGTTSPGRSSFPRAAITFLSGH